MREQVEKNWKTPLSIDDYRQNRTFLSLLNTGSYNLKEKKDKIRSFVAKRRYALSDNEIKEKSLIISRHLKSLESFKLSKSVALYSPILNEVRTESIFMAAVQIEKEVYFPRVSGSSLSFYRVYNLDQLRLGKFRVLEPEPSSHEIKPEEIDIFLMPGLAFDNSGNRLGYGKGYYDRALKNVSEHKRVGLSYSFQILDSIPSDVHDQKVGAIVTEQGVVFSRRNLGGK